MPDIEIPEYLELEKKEVFCRNCFYCAGMSYTSTSCARDRKKVMNKHTEEIHWEGKTTYDVSCNQEGTCPYYKEKRRWWQFKRER